MLFSQRLCQRLTKTDTDTDKHLPEPVHPVEELREGLKQLKDIVTH